MFDKDDIDTNHELIEKFKNQIHKVLRKKNIDELEKLADIANEIDEHIIYGRTMCRKRKQNLNQAIKTIEWYLTSRYFETVDKIERYLDALSIEITKLYQSNTSRDIIHLHEKIWLIANNELTMHRHNLKQVELIIYNARLD